MDNNNNLANKWVELRAARAVKGHVVATNGIGQALVRFPSGTARWMDVKRDLVLIPGQR